MFQHPLHQAPFLAGIKLTSRPFSKQLTHYEILKLKRNCTNAEIKKAYIELTKKYHPDRNEKVNPKLFHDVSNAYKVLSRPDQRTEYDKSLSSHVRRRNFYEHYTPRRNPMDDPSFYHNRNFAHKQYNSDAYYGIRGVHRVSNSVIVLACFVFMCMGATLQIMTIRHSFTFKREQMRQKSEIANSHLEESRKAAEENGTQKQLAILEARFKMNGADTD